MPVLDRVAAIQKDIVEWRRDLHAHPELGFEENRTATFVAEQLRAFGCDEVTTGVGKTGVVAVIRGNHAVPDGRTKVIGLRADMDALPIHETTNLPYASKHEGVMHACGHDGHTAMLLGAAKCLSQDRDFAGTVVLIFQPAEEIGAGAIAMLEDRLMDRFEIEQIYGMHTLPGLPIGTIGIRAGAVMAATDSIEIRIEGRSGHPGRAHLAIDAIMVTAQLLNSLQQITSQNVNALEAANMTFQEIHGGGTHRVIAEKVELRGSLRTLSPDVHQLIKNRVREVASGVALASGARIDVKFEPDHGCVYNSPAQTAVALTAAQEIVGNNIEETPPTLLGEDFATMSQVRPGTFVFCGNGDSAALHHPSFDFNDESAAYGTSYWLSLVEKILGEDTFRVAQPSRIV
ncbi:MULTISPECIES: amidohydrolase [Mesorhizobium]|uniref:amidohydrolase n=1 Tax=Mesorhizobium TaxID=68287 RepID=UPI00042387FC|nr:MULTISPECIES: amidohydrolase [Mesorhizobium]BCG82892.1 amidohydrolase [Mesorhizobium sp. 113-3-3]BCG90769.1 amidohydrolase [Mesorhizobium sp. 113-3-9]